MKKFKTRKLNRKLVLNRETIKELTLRKQVYGGAQTGLECSGTTIPNMCVRNN